MILPDVNVLIYAFREDSPEHAVCRSWLTQIITGDARFGISPLALGAVVRITMNRRSYRTASTPDDAFGLSSNGFAPKRTHGVPASGMPGMRCLPLNGVASGSRWIATTLGLQD
jgi:hypothetical protein